ncbi:MAG: 50S ribosomal protein L17 [Chlorobi bacterium]|nr:50S ribosomal protein L17 [Chlorobiota bacterium]
MRHRNRKSFNHLGRTSAHRKAMLSNMASSLIKNKRINTTVAKAKALREYVEPLITKAKNDTTHSRRVVFSYLQDKVAVTELFREISVKVGDRPGGYTRIIKLGNRLGDNADMAMIELVDYNENLLGEKTAKKAKTSRRRRGGKKKTTAEAATVKEEVAAKKPEAEKPVEVAEEPKEEVKAEKPEAKAEESKAEVKAEKSEEKAEETLEQPKAEIKEEKKEQETKAEEPATKAEAKKQVKPVQEKENKNEDTEEGKKTEEKK